MHITKRRWNISKISLRFDKNSPWKSNRCAHRATYGCQDLTASCCHISIVFSKGVHTHTPPSTSGAPWTCVLGSKLYWSLAATLSPFCLSRMYNNTRASHPPSWNKLHEWLYHRQSPSCSILTGKAGRRRRKKTGCVTIDVNRAGYRRVRLPSNHHGPIHLDSSVMSPQIVRTVRGNFKEVSSPSNGIPQHDSPWSLSFASFHLNESPTPPLSPSHSPPSP